MAIVLHPFADISAISAPHFVQNLISAYTHGNGKSSSKFQALRSQVIKALPSAPPPGPATFVVNCLEALVCVGPPHDESLSHMLLSALCQLDKSKWADEDRYTACRLAGSFFFNVLVGKLKVESRVAVKIPETFGFDLKDIEDIVSAGQDPGVLQMKAAKGLVECYLLDLLQKRSYTSAVSLIKHFNLKNYDSQSLIITIIDNGQTNLAVDWATYLGKDVLKFLVQYCTQTGLYKVAYKVVKQHKLEAEFPDAYHLYRQSSLRKLVRKGLWEVAQMLAEGDSLLIDYLVNLAVEVNDAEKLEELCEHFHLDRISMTAAMANTCGGPQYLQLDNVISKDKVHWIDSHEGLLFAERAMAGIDFVGIDCEWKPDCMKGGGPSKVSILQLASSELVLILDLISLFKKCQTSLNNFIRLLFDSQDVVKLGYAIHNDLKRLSHSFMEIDAFCLCESVLDLQIAFGMQKKGGLSALTKMVFGIPLNKHVRMSDWEARPLSRKQLDYAALDAAILLPIFQHLANKSDPRPDELDWKCHLRSHRVIRKSKEKVLGNGKLAEDHNYKMPIAPHEELVMASCELLGTPIPGLLKTELFEFTRSAKLSPPVFNTANYSCASETAFYSTVKVANTTYMGRIASSKKDAEFWAAHVALSKVRIGTNALGNGECTQAYSDGLDVLKVCSNNSKSGCLSMKASLTRRYDINLKYWNTSICFFQSSMGYRCVQRISSPLLSVF
ncbi:hypothetical protein KP509_01G044300 [Ceratopteris richardii]|uniref:3'-5' exonuclease domain-containing protein n=1 Tax=Ceratopteris richardii TaxID=49495 RepID=A0A8T2VKV3_CERRI|nr:hypothetical protein KP509_01G044300 [Ceratopteris richardii]